MAKPDLLVTRNAVFVLFPHDHNPRTELKLAEILDNAKAMEWGTVESYVLFDKPIDGNKLDEGEL